MIAATFDSLTYFDKLTEAGVPEAQARVQAECLRAQSEAFNALIKNYDEYRKKELATKGDLQETRAALIADIQDTRQEIEKVRAEVEEYRADTRAEMKGMENRLLIWQMGVALALAAIMAKGFNWLGF